MQYQIDVRDRKDSIKSVKCQTEIKDKNDLQELFFLLEHSPTVLDYRILSTYHRGVRIPKVRHRRQSCQP